MLDLVRSLVNRERAWRLARIGDAPCQVRVRQGFVMTIDPSQAMDRGYFLGTYERHLVRTLRRLVHPGDVVADIGTHKGYISCLLAARVGRSGRVLSIDADPRAFAELDRNCQLNGFDHVDRRQYAVGAEPGKAVFTLTSMLGNSTLYPNEIARGQTVSSIEVLVLPFDTIAIEAGLADRRFQLIKIDAEGAEPSVLRGMHQRLAVDRPALCLEVNRDSLLAAASSPAALGADLQALGYHLYEFDRQGWRGAVRYRRLERLHAERACYELLAIHPESQARARKIGRAHV